ncbi:hypothetical protein AALB47_14960 [Lachnospiraceae bacterium 54-11]
MTEKQIKRMIRKEGYRFCLFGIPAGITAGIIFAYLLEPNGITIINAIATENMLETLPVDWTYETLVKQDAMVISGTSVQKEVYHTCPSTGEKLTIRWFDGTEHSIDVLIAGTSEKRMNEGFYLPKETIESCGEIWI